MSKSTSYQSLFIWVLASVFVGVFIMPLFTRLAAAIPIYYWWIIILCVLVAIIIYRVRQINRQSTPTQKVNFKKLRATDPSKRIEWIKKNVLGHGQAITLIMKHIEQNLFLTRAGRHLGAYLLAGPPSTGKTFFAKILAEAIFGKENYLSFNSDDYSQINSRELIPQKIISFYKKSAEFVLILENIEQANADLYQDLLYLIEKGEVRDSQTDERYLLSGTIVIITTELSADVLHKYSTYKEYPSQLQIRGLITENRIDKNLQALVDGAYIFGKLPPQIICTIAILQMQKYYQSYEINLTYVDPEALLIILNKNNHYEDSGVGYLSKVLKSLSDPLIYEAKKLKLTSVEVEFDKKSECLKIRRQKKKAS